MRTRGVFATNTSSISVTQLAAVSGRPDRVVGMHFFNPVPVMRLVEIIPALQTSSDVVDLTIELTKKLGRTPVPCKDTPSFHSEPHTHSHDHRCGPGTRAAWPRPPISTRL